MGVAIQVWEAHAPSRAIVGASPTTFLVAQENHFGEAPKCAREGACAPRKGVAARSIVRHFKKFVRIWQGETADVLPRIVECKDDQKSFYGIGPLHPRKPRHLSRPRLG